MQKSLLFTLKCAVSGVLLWIIFRHVDLREAWAHLALASVLPMVAALILGVLILVLNAWRWQLILDASGFRANLLRLTAHSMVGFFFGQALPSIIGGDGVRAWMLYRDGASPSLAIRSLLIERLFGLGVLIVLGGIGLPWLLARMTTHVEILFLVEAAIVAGLGLGLLSLWLLKRSEWLTRTRLGSFIHALMNDTWMILVRPKTAAFFILLSLISQILSCAMIWATGVAIGAGLSWIDALIVLPGVFVLSALPISIAGWGLREGIMLFALTLFGVSPSHAVAMSVLFGLTCLVVGLAGGIVWLLMHGVGEWLPAEIPVDAQDKLPDPVVQSPRTSA